MHHKTLFPGNLSRIFFSSFAARPSLVFLCRSSLPVHRVSTRNLISHEGGSPFDKLNGDVACGFSAAPLLGCPLCLLISLSLCWKKLGLQLTHSTSTALLLSLYDPCSAVSYVGQRERRQSHAGVGDKQLFCVFTQFQSRHTTPWLSQNLVLQPGLDSVLATRFSLV